MLDWLNSILALPYEKERKSRFQQRPDISEHEFFCTYYANSGLSEESVKNTLRLLAGELGVPASKIRPDDSLFNELSAPEDAWDDGVGLTFAMAAAEARKQGFSSEITTVDQLIRFYAKLDDSIERR